MYIRVFQNLCCNGLGYENTESTELSESRESAECSESSNSVLLSLYMTCGNVYTIYSTLSITYMEKGNIPCRFRRCDGP